MTISRALIAVLLSAALTGCRRSADSSERAMSESSAPVASPSAAAAPTAAPGRSTESHFRRNPEAASSQQPRPDEVWEDEQGRRYLGRVPYDVFFDHPLDIAGDPAPADGSPTAGTSGGSDETASVVSDTDAVPPNGTSGDSADNRPAWHDILPAAVIETEMKAVRNFLNEKLRSVGTYNASVTMLPAAAALGAALAVMAANHEGDISWKDDALWLRDLAAGMNETPLQRGAKDQRRLLRLFEDMADILNRSRPAGLPDPQDADPADVADMRLLMQRMETAEQRLRTDVSRESIGRSREQIHHETWLLSGLMALLSTESYGYADDPDFLGHATKLRTACDGMRTAADAGDFDTYQVHLSAAAAACQACHRDYRTN